MCMNRMDLAERIYEKSIEIYKNEFEIIGIEQLPLPEVEYAR